MCTTSFSDLGITECPICHAIVPEAFSVYKLDEKGHAYAAKVDPHHDWHIERGDIEQ